MTRGWKKSHSSLLFFIVHKNYYIDEMKYKEIGETCNKHGREQNMSIITVLIPEGIDFL